VSVWAISDLHLSFAHPDRRERFAGRWRDHAQAIERNWRQTVLPEDLVLLPGDLSMARNHRDLQPDFEWLGQLPGTKVLSPGNHDAWWNGASAVRPMLRPSMLTIGEDPIETHHCIVCGSRGAPVSTDRGDDQEFVERELSFIDRALDQAQRRRSPGAPLYVLWHFPPFDQHHRPGPIVERLEAADVTACVYGHLHIESQWALAVQGEVRGVRYHCVAADAVGFRPLRIDGGSRGLGRRPRR
jgi:uncharacterized protein